jgi:hypothetical protein
MSRIPAIPFFLLMQSALLASCAPVGVVVPAPVLDGPALHIAGQYSGMSLEGTMDRGCMVGVGSLSLRAARVADAEKTARAAGTGKTAGDNAETAGPDVGTAAPFACSGTMDVRPDKKARVNGILECTSGRRMVFSLRNLGPDQGLGIARESREGDLLVFFYHASESEAERRLPRILAEMDEIRSSASVGENR